MLELKGLAKTLIDRVTADKDVVICVSGDEGSGKSTLAGALGIECDPLFNMERNVLYLPSAKDIKNTIYNLPPFSPVIIDEGIKSLYKLNWATKGQKFLNMVYAVCRKENKITIICIPRFTDIGEFFRNHRIKVWLHIVDEISNKKDVGRAAMMVRTWNPVTTDPWGLDIYQRILQKRQKKGVRENFYSLNDKIRMLEFLPSYVGVLNFRWLSEHHWRKYLELKEANHADEMEEMVEDAKNLLTEKWKRRSLMAIKAMLAMGKTQEEVGKEISMDRTTISKLLEQEKNAKKIAEFA